MINFSQETWDGAFAALEKAEKNRLDLNGEYHQYLGKVTEENGVYYGCFGAWLFLKEPKEENMRLPTPVLRLLSHLCYPPESWGINPFSSYSWTRRPDYLVNMLRPFFESRYDLSQVDPLFFWEEL